MFSKEKRNLIFILGSKNIPVDVFQSNDETIEKHLAAPNQEVVFICRRGNDSQRACAAFKQFCDRRGLQVDVKDVIGGLHAWAKNVDKSFPVY